MQERFSHLKTALLLEREEELKRSKSIHDNATIADRVAEGVTLYPIAYVSSHYDAFENLILIVQLNADQQDSNFGSNERVAFFSAVEKETVDGIIVSNKHNELYVQLLEDDVPDWMSAGKIGLNSVSDTRTIDIQLATVETILKEELKIANTFYNYPKKINYEVIETINGSLNHSQNEAVSFGLSSNPFTIIHGPPGTGKTSTLVVLITNLIKQGKRVMVAAPSNASVDHITAELLKHTKSILRLGNSFKINEIVSPYTLREKLLNSKEITLVNRLKKDAETIRKKAFKFKRNFGAEEFLERKALKKELRLIKSDIRKIEQDLTHTIIDTAQIVTGTFTALQNSKLKKMGFDCVIVDEAGQAIEPAIWSVAHYADHLILAGDPFQLPPTIFSMKSKQLGLEISLIEQGIKLGIPTFLLDTQYRMNDSIMQFSNEKFYDGKLISADANAAIKIEQDDFMPIEFIDTAGCNLEEELILGGGIKNVGEIEILARRLDELPIESGSIGLISPYRMQVNLMAEYFSKSQKTVQTIDSFQGQERDVILISLVRSNESGTIGFLTDYRRMNVAMTRAKKKLIIIGDSATIGADSFYSDLLEYIEQHGSYRSAWEFLS